jgi:molybdopterin-guanine dinucleotide biosynthesis protein B
VSARRPLVAFVGPHNSGKTGLVERLTRLAALRRLKVGVLKRAAQPLVFEPAGKDSARFARAGAARVVTHGPGMLFALEPVSSGPGARELARLYGAGIDLWLMESYAPEAVPWIAVARQGQTTPPADRHLIAVVGRALPGIDRPRFSALRPRLLLDFLVGHFGL